MRAFFFINLKHRIYGIEWNQRKATSAGNDLNRDSNWIVYVVDTTDQAIALIDLLHRKKISNCSPSGWWFGVLRRGYNG